MEDPSSKKLDKAEKLAIARGVAVVFILVVFIIFIAQNSDRVRVHLVFGTADVRLIWVFLGCGVIGAVVGWLVRERWHAARTKRLAVKEK